MLGKIKINQVAMAKVLGVIQMKRLITLLIIFSLTFTTVYANDYFYEIAFGLECGKSNVIHKWDKPEIKISIKGDPTDGYIKEVNKVTKELTELTGITFDMMDENADIEIYFIKQSDFAKHVPNNKLVQNSNGYFYVWWDKNNVIYKAKVLISIDTGVMREQYHLIREELTQSLGLMNDSFAHPDSMFYQGPGLERKYTDIDKEIIKLLYNPKIKSGMTKSRIQKIFKEAN
jgi:hypothetical protein